jgi:hypothetical protein
VTLAQRGASLRRPAGVDDNTLPWRTATPEICQKAPSERRMAVEAGLMPCASE